MPESTRSRSYHSPRRQEQAAATRRHILQTAQRLFERDGYPTTSMAVIAAESGVAVKTVYLTFDSKSGLLRALWQFLLGGQDDDAPVVQRDWYREVIEEPDPRRVLALNARNSRLVKTRAGALMAVIRGAATTDPDLDDLWQHIQTDFHANQRSIVQLLQKKDALRAGLTAERASDILWALNHPDVWHLFVAQRQWTPDDYERWIADTSCEQLLGEP